MRCWLVRNNGFFSVYALLWLNIACAGALLIIFTTAAINNAKKEMKIYDAQIVSIYRTKRRMKEMNQCLIEQEQKQTAKSDSEVKDEQALSESDIDLPSNEAVSDESECIAEPETFRYHGVLIRCEYEKNGCSIRLNEHLLHITYDIQSLAIIDLEYL